MKRRLGFVSNSSSSSFIVRKKFLDTTKLELVRRHDEVAKELQVSNYEDTWSMTEHEAYFDFDTTMDNCNLRMMFDSLGIPNEDYYTPEEGDINLENLLSRLDDK
jgi:hypothetical protein